MKEQLQKAGVRLAALWSIKEIPKKRGRPATGKDPLVTMRLPAEVIALLDKIAAAEETSRSEVIRSMIDAGLKRKR